MVINMRWLWITLPDLVLQAMQISIEPDKGARKFILVEQGEYFEPHQAAAEVGFSADWDGR